MKKQTFFNICLLVMLLFAIYIAYESFYLRLPMTACAIIVFLLLTINIKGDE